MDNKNLLVSSKQLVGEKIRPTKIALVVSSLLLMNGVWAEIVEDMTISGTSQVIGSAEIETKKAYSNVHFDPKSKLTIINSDIKIFKITSENKIEDNSLLKIENSQLHVVDAHLNNVDISITAKSKNLPDSSLYFGRLVLENDAIINSDNNDKATSLSIDKLELKGFSSNNGTQPTQGVNIVSNNQNMNVDIGSITGNGKIFFSHSATPNVKNLDEKPNRTELQIDTIDVDYFQSIIIGYDLVQLNKVDISENRMFRMNKVQDAFLGSTTI